MAERLLLDVDEDGRVSVSAWRAGETLPNRVGDPIPLVWPLDGPALEELRWYLEDYLRAPFGVYGERGPRVEAQFPKWGAQVFEAVFGSGPARDAYTRARARGGPVEIVVRSGTAQHLGLPWELMADPERPTPIALDDQVVVSRSLPTAALGNVFTVGGSRLRVLMVISRPSGTADVGYQMIARPLLRRLEAVRGQVDLVVLRPPTLEHLERTLEEAREAGEPFQIVHFDGHGVFGEAPASGGGWPSVMFQGPGPQGMLAFEKATGGSDLVPAGRVAQVLKKSQVPVVVLNACQSAVLGSQLEAAVATRLLQEGAGAVVAMAYSVYAVAAAEFMTAFYERLFAGDLLSAAVSAGRQRLDRHDLRPSPKGLMPLADWVVPVVYTRADVHFAGLRTGRDQQESLDELLDRMREQPADADTGDEASPESPLAAVGEFTGRDALLYTLDTAARLDRVVVLYGPGGTGKTELAKAFGRWWRDTGALDDERGVIWHSFEPGVASFGLDGVINSIGLGLFGAQFALLDQEKRQSLVETTLVTRRLLLIWDNFESVHTLPDPTHATQPLTEPEREELRGFLDRIAAKGKSAIIVTSRTPETWLGTARRRIKVGGLESDEANEYAEQLLSSYPDTKKRRESKAFGELMQWLDGHPLSMRLILPRLDSTAPRDLLAGLQGTTPLADADGGGRTTSLSASIAYSFTHLSAEDQHALTVVSLFHGVVDADVLGQFSTLPEVPEWYQGRTASEWAQVLERATEVGLLTSLGVGMYRIHPALPAYLTSSWQALAPGGHHELRTAAELALLDAYATFGGWLLQQVQGGDAQLAMVLIHLQRRTMGSLLGYALDHSLWDQAQGIAQPLDEYWDARGLVEEARAWVNRARVAMEDSDGNAPDLNSSAGALWLFLTGSQANRHVRAGQLDQAERTYRDILHALRLQPATSKQRSRLAVIYHQLGRVAQERGQLTEAEARCRQSLTIAEDLGDRPGMALSYHQLGVVAQDRGQLDEAETRYRQSLTIKEDLGDRPGMARSYHQLGIVAQDRGQLDEAETRYRQSLTIKEDLGDRPGMARSYHQLGIVAHERGQLTAAEDWYRQALTIAEDLGDRPGMASTYHQLGVVTHERGQLTAAEDWYRQSLTIKEDIGDRPGMALTYHQLGVIAQDRGQLDEAETRYRQALTIKEDIGNRPVMARTYGQLGLLAEKQQQPEKVLKWMVRCAALFEQFPHPLTGPAPAHLKRLTHCLGIRALEQTWQSVTGGPLPPPVRDFVLAEDPPATD
ncbi:tetratricopeptide repeat protein [Streptomyces liliifuscus]|uniref:Tetratricopeptide repeat protein n=1 Tax=Streptomyces liliifuscus TaxID=2797636 RepID=A0A7T7KXG0_9ACTN|nr:tetratricopeptide repeat protein [Streptomyces liliifuscus]QQM42200.1 tetratricopeptide repeat protein [Streptomyces liliifuscus]